MRLGVVEGKTCLRMRADFRQFATRERGRPGGMVGLKPQSRIAGFLRQRQQPRAKLPRVFNFASPEPEHPLAPERREDVRTLAQAIAPGLRPLIGCEHFGRTEPMGGYVDGADADMQLDLELGALGLIRDVPDGVERAPEVGERLLARAAPKCRGG